MAFRPPDNASAQGPKIRIYAPHAHLIQFADDDLQWRVGKHPDELLREVTPEPEAFNKFLDLAEASPKRILAFAKRNGVLGLCKHGLPTCHGPRLPDPDESFSPPYWPPRYCTPGFASNGAIIEPFASWRALASAASAVLVLKGSLDEPTRQTQATGEQWERDWRSAQWLAAQQYERAGHWDCELEHRFSKLPLPKLLKIRPSRWFGQREVAHVVNLWLACGGIRLEACYWKGRNQRRLELVTDARFGPNLFGFLALQLAQEWAGSKRIARCPCEKLFPAPPTASPRRRNFCPECRNAGKPGTFHMAAYRHRISAARRLSAQGATVAQIAEELGREPRQIRKWVMGK